MFDVGFWELLLIGTLGLLVLGPERLPRVARRLGRWTGQAKAMARSLRTQLESEMELAELKKQADAFKQSMEQEVTAKPAPASEGKAKADEPTPKSEKP
jgi:sec-independent protein translocase protein TatB